MLLQSLHLNQIIIILLIITIIFFTIFYRKMVDFVDKHILKHPENDKTVVENNNTEEPSEDATEEFFEIKTKNDIPNDTEDKDTPKYDVILVSSGINKIILLHEVRKVTGFGLNEAKALIDNTPSIIKKGVTKEQAESIKRQLEFTEATVEIR